jgi:aminoglycoside 6'-N-acetyltransferase
VRLVPIAPDHHSRLREIHMLPEVSRWWGDPSEKWPGDADPEEIKYTVLLDGEIIGVAEWYEEKEPRFRHAGLDLFLDPAVHGRGLGTEVVRVLCAHLIDDHAHHRVVIDPEVDNEVAIACYRKVGFKDVGVMRRYFLNREDEWRDGLLMDLLAEEFVRE